MPKRLMISPHLTVAALETRYRSSRDLVPHSHGQIIWLPAQGQRPRAMVQHRYQWCYLYAFVQPSTGHTVWLLLPAVSIAAFTVALAEFAHAVGVGPNRQILLVLDGVGWHASPHVQVPVGGHLHCLPPYSPAFQPAERLQPLIN